MENKIKVPLKKRYLSAIAIELFIAIYVNFLTPFTQWESQFYVCLFFGIQFLFILNFLKNVESGVFLSEVKRGLFYCWSGTLIILSALIVGDSFKLNLLNLCFTGVSFFFFFILILSILLMPGIYIPKEKI